MVSCPACSAPTDSVDRFCGRCGVGLAGISAVDPGLSRFCQGCGGSIEPDAQFCRSCGAQAPEPVENVFAGMSLNGHSVVAVTEPVADLVAHRPPKVPITAPPAPKAPAETIPLRSQEAEAIPRPSQEAPTETIRRPAPEASRELAQLSGETAARPRPRPAPRTTTATIERTAVPPAPPTPGPEPIPGPEIDEAPVETVRSRGGFPWGGTLALVGALAVILSAIVDWGGPFPESLPRDIGASLLLDPAVSAAGPTLGLILLLLGTLGALVALVGMAAPSFTFLRRFVGLVTFLIPFGFVLRTVQALAEESRVSDLASTLGVGVVMASVGALLQFAPRKRRRHR